MRQTAKVGQVMAGKGSFAFRLGAVLAMGGPSESFPYGQAYADRAGERQRSKVVHKLTIKEAGSYWEDLEPLSEA